jgi:hypothetical protein
MLEIALGSRRGENGQEGGVVEDGGAVLMNSRREMNTEIVLRRAGRGDSRDRGSQKWRFLGQKIDKVIRNCIPGSWDKPHAGINHVILVLYGLCSDHANYPSIMHIMPYL